jgi:hypothetical protein
MKRIAGIAILVLALAIFCQGNYRFSQNFLTTAVACGKGATLVNGTGFTSASVDIMNQSAQGVVTVTFTRAAGTASTMDFEFQVSYDGGTTWSTAYYAVIQVPTNETAATNAVRVTIPVDFWGVSHVRLYRIKNNDAANDTTACNARISF